MLQSSSSAAAAAASVPATSADDEATPLIKRPKTENDEDAAVDDSKAAGSSKTAFRPWSPKAKADLADSPAGFLADIRSALSSSEAAAGPASAPGGSSGVLDALERLEVRVRDTEASRAAALEELQNFKRK